MSQFHHLRSEFLTIVERKNAKKKNTQKMNEKYSEIENKTKKLFFAFVLSDRNKLPECDAISKI